MRYIEHALAHGIARHRAGHFREARSVYESLLSLSMDPKICAIALANLSAIHENAGRWAEARMASNEALNINDKNGVALISAIRCDRSEGNPQQGLERLSAWPTYSLPPDLIHEMALCYDAIGQTTKAYHSFREANRRSSFEDLDVDRTLITRYIERMLTVHSGPIKAPYPEPPPLVEPSPIFIVGFNCSGTTEIGKLLGHQEQFERLGEQSALDSARKVLNGKDVGPLGELTEAELQAARTKYFEVAHRSVKVGTRIVDTTPLNVLSLPLVHRIFPESCIIRMVRHPVETVFLAFRKLQRVNAISCHMDSMSRCAQLFLATNAMGNHYRDTLGIPMTDIAFEDFTQAPQEYGKAITESLGEAWVPVSGFAPKSPIDQWVRYKKDLAPWISDLKKLAQTQGYPAK